MSIQINARIVSTVLEDSRFLVGETIDQALKRDSMFGKSLKLYLDNGTFLVVEPITDRWGEQLIGCEVGRWERAEDNTIKELT